MEGLILIFRIFFLMGFIFSLVQVFSISMSRGLALILLGVSNYLYLMLRFGNLMRKIKYLIPLVLLLLYFLCIKSWADNQTGNPLGIGLGAAVLAIAGVAVLVFWQEILTIKHLGPDLMNLITAIKNWRETGENWLALVVLLLLGTNLYVLYDYLLYRKDG